MGKTTKTGGARQDWFPDKNRQTQDGLAVGQAGLGVLLGGGEMAALAGGRVAEQRRAEPGEVAGLDQIPNREPAGPIAGHLDLK